MAAGRSTMNAAHRSRRQAQLRNRPWHNSRDWTRRIGAASFAVALLSLSVAARSQAPPRQAAEPPPQGAVPPDRAEPLPQIAPQIPIPGIPPIPRRSNGPAAERPTVFVTDRAAARRLRLAESRLANGVFEEAVDLLQSILDSKEDAAAPAENDTTRTVFQSLKRQAIDRLSQLPAEGRRVYELKYGVAARGQLEEAIKQGNWDGVETVSRRYFHTAAGREATYRLAVWADDRGESLEAALLFQRLLDDGESSFEPRLSLRAASSWSRAGLADQARRSAERYLELTNGRPGALPETIAHAQTADELLTWLKKTNGSSDAAVDVTWPNLGGGSDRLSDVDPVAIADGAAWSHRLHEPTPWDSPREAVRASRLAAGLKLLTAAALSTGRLTQTAFHPVVAQNAVVFRTLRNIQAVDLASGELLWQTEPPHDRYFDAAVKELEAILPYGDEFGTGGLINIGEAVSQFAWQNLTTGTLSTDGRFVYAIEGTGRAGTPQLIAQGLGRPVAFGNEDFNTLFAYELTAEGRIAWSAGGPPGEDPTAGVFFLGPPLPLGGRLYALAERDGSIRLLVMDPLADAADRVVWSQTLVESDEPLTASPQRRLSGLSPTFSDGVLVCPTGAGAVIGVDLARRVLLWGYDYSNRSATASPALPGLSFGGSQAALDDRMRWLDAVPRIAGGIVFLTPFDSSDVHCLDLKTGSILWKHPRGALLYLAAVHQGMAVFVGRQSLLALDVRSGQTVWERPLDQTPAGRGVLSGDLYHLPLMSGEVATINLLNHQELVRSSVGPDIAAGNLIAVSGRLISQSAEVIAGFHRDADLEATQRDGDAASSGGTAQELTLQGTRALHRGDVDQGLSLLKRAATTGESPQAKRAYVRVLLDGLQSNFSAYRKYEQDLRAIIDDPDQKADFFRLMADGLEAAAEPAAAFDALLALAASDVAEPGYTIADGDRIVRLDRLDRVRAGTLMSSSPPAERDGMAARLQDVVKQAAASRDTVALQRLVSIFDGAAGRDAWHELEMLVKTSAPPIDRERILLISETRAAGPDADVSKTETAAHSPATPAFDIAWHAEYVPDEIKENRRHLPADVVLPIQQVGPAPASHAGWQFEVAGATPALIARDATGQEQWSLPLQAENDDPFGRQVTTAGRFEVRFSGHLLAAALGTKLLVLDLLSSESPPRVLWSADLTDRTYGDAFINRRIVNGPADGPIGFAGPGLLLYQAGSALSAVDPLTGEVFWRRMGVPYNCELSGDREFVTLQLPSRGDVVVLSADDGRLIAQQTLPKFIRRFGWFGTNIITWRPAELGLELSCDDVARGTNRWTLGFSEAALATATEGGEVAVFEVPTGRLQLIRSHDGAVVFESSVEPDPAVASIAVARRFGRVILFTLRREPAGPIRVEADRSRTPINGLVHGFDGQGGPVWSAAIRQQYVDLQQPGGLPILLLTAKRYAPGAQASHHAAVLDVRNGQTLIEQRRLSEFQPFEFHVDADTPRIEIESKGARILLTPSNKPLPPAKSDRLADLTRVGQGVPASAP